MAQDKVFSPTLIPSLDTEVKVCHADELLDPLLCNSIVKILNYHTTVPYFYDEPSTMGLGETALSI